MKSSVFRTREDIARDYGLFLHEKGFIPKNRLKFYLEEEEGQNEVLEALLEKLYETEEIKGATVSSVDAFYHFCEFVVKRDPKTGRRVWNSLVEKLFKDLEHHQFSSIMVARESGKTFFCSALYIPFKMFLSPMMDILLVCNVPSMCIRAIRVFKRIIESNELLLSKKARDAKWSERDIEYNKGFLETSTIGSVVRSAHPNLAICDDILRDDNAYSELDYEDFVLGQLFPTVQRSKGRLVVLGCVSGDTRITTPTGTPRIDSFRTFSYGQRNFKKLIYGEGGYHWATRFQENPKTDTIKVTTKYGYSLEGTPHHKIRVMKGSSWKYHNVKWKRLDEISEEDRVIIQTTEGHFGDLSLSKKEAYLLGLYTAEGSLDGVKNYRITITSTEFDELKKFVAGDRWKTQKDGMHHRLSDRSLIVKFEDFGLKKQRCYEKTVPEMIFSSDKETIKQYLRGLFDGDGTITRRGIDLVSTSYKLLEQVQQLLLKFGVISSINLSSPSGRKSIKCGISKHDCYSLYILRECVPKFKEIGFNLRRKKERLDWFGGKGKTNRLWNRMIAVKVGKIERKKSETFDFVIPETHTYNSNGFISHNTPQTSTDIFYRLMNEDDELKGNIVTNGYSKKKFWSKVYPAILDFKTKKILLPEVYTWEDLMRIKETMGDLYFQREYMCRPYSEDQALFPFYLLRRCTDGSENFIEEGIEGKQYVVGVDVATSGAASADFSAFVVLELRPDKEKEEETLKKYVKYIYHEKGLPVDEQVRIIADISRSFNDAYVLVEINNVGVSFYQKLVSMNINVGQFRTDSHTKKDLIRYLINEMRTGHLFFPVDVPETQKLKEELRNFGVRRTRGKERMEALSGKDDLVMALALANKAASQGIMDGLDYAICFD